MSCWAVLLLLVTAATAVPVKTPEPYEKVIARAIDFYNQGPTVKYAFRLLTSSPPPEVLVRDCSGHFSTQEACPVIAITCDVAPPQPVRVTRWWPLVRIGAKILGHGISFFHNKG
nr:cathelicidin-3-like [Chrysemys picta bellii]